MKRLKDEALIAFLAIGIFGGLSIFTLPFRGSHPAPESGLTTEPCTLDEAVEFYEERIQDRKESLDALLESAEMEAQSMEIVIEPRLVTQEETETESVEESTTEEETVVSEPSAQAVDIFQPVDSMMAADLQAWVYAYATHEAINPYVIMAICERESGCTANILGDGGRAYGMMQVQVQWIQPRLAAHGWTNDTMLQAQPNIMIGIEILKEHLLQGKGLEWALTAYRYGPNQANICAKSDYSTGILSRAAELEAQNE